MSQGSMAGPSEDYARGHADVFNAALPVRRIAKQPLSELQAVVPVKDLHRCNAIRGLRRFDSLVGFHLGQPLVDFALKLPGTGVVGFFSQPACNQSRWLI